MRKTKIDEISLGAKDLATTATELLQFFNSYGEDGSPSFDVSKAIHGTDISYADCVSRITTIAEIADKFGSSKHFLMVPVNRITQLKQRIDEAQQHLSTLGNQFRQMLKSGGGSKLFNYDNFHLQTTNGQNHDFRGHFKNVSDSTEALLDAFYQVLIVLRPTRSTYSFQAAANALSSLIEDSSAQIHKLHEENAALRQAVATASDQVSAAESQAQKAKAAAEEASRTKDESASDRRTIGEYLADATEKKTAIETAHTAVSSLEDKVEEYREKFNSFDRQLENRNNDFEQGKEKQEKLFANFEAKRQAADSLLEQIEGLLPGATSAGLATAYNNRRVKAENSAKLYSGTFFIGIVVLAVSAAATVTQTLSLWPFAWEFIRVESAKEYLDKILFKLPLVIPVLWATLTVSKRRSEMQRLAEEYAHKEALAQSYEGFKQQIVELGKDDDALLRSLLEVVLTAISINAAKTLEGKHGEKMPVQEVIEETLKMSRGV
jgi:predicted  nucleic acid-binding Zn-ribbon protein